MEFYIVYFPDKKTLSFANFTQDRAVSVEKLWYVSVHYVDWARRYEVWGTDIQDLVAFAEWGSAEAYVEEQVNAKIVSLQSAQK